LELKITGGKDELKKLQAQLVNEISMAGSGLQQEFQTLNKQLATIGPVVQASAYLGVSPLAAGFLLVVTIFASFMLFFNVGTAFI
jgi:hypothetical protein